MKTPATSKGSVKFVSIPFLPPISVSLDHLLTSKIVKPALIDPYKVQNFFPNIHIQIPHTNLYTFLIINSINN